MLEAQQSAPNARKVRDVLRSESMAPVAEEPTSITVSEALRLWRTRLGNVQFTHQPIEGIPELVGRLESLSPQRKINQYGFIGKGSAATLFFTRDSNTFLGCAIVTKKYRN
jgi:hypothetical protein